MPKKISIYKVPNGKLLKIFLDEENGKITDIKITGDFFTYPEENIEQLEEELKGCVLRAEELFPRIHRFVAKMKTKFFGLDEVSLVTTIIKASAR